ncbi:hypothetical protein [uncultured Tateyamaria sp.]|uniref:hypothetical protein n=1 Tax=uncultured Tateyamaria sp. TaxID=455651 RepID=UPI0026157F93|nr:hypothetical protein [uncultured Tateyamaria sp.]
MSFRYDIALAAKMVEASYELFKHPKRRNSLKGNVKGSLNDRHVQAVFTTQNILLIPGSNSVGDYIMFNLRVLNLGGKKYRMNDDLTETWGSNVTWHQGFMKHAKIISDWMRQNGYKPKFIVGHSLGAAATQILVRTHDVHGIAFAAPRVTRGTAVPAPASKCLCLNRLDDRVCDLPSSFEHLGNIRTGVGQRKFLRFDHKMARYREMVTKLQADGALESHWPAR